ncbi:NADP-dependent oxidoreductase [Actinoplanes sp. M2I2]|uniref:MDR family NADP-dependent oxidoreductase n=1 Tax=Actinoplanes sp. M2I2 TaxID=1734444 RepID=UPI0020217777|nr:NADP-dependent oxidoreductase [Actinoplanes sp. M2I2]
MLATQIVMSRRPSGPLTKEHFRTETVVVPPPPTDHVLLRNVLVSVAPAARAVMQGPTYRPQLQPGEPVPSSVLGQVVAGPPGGPAIGSIVGAAAAWQEYSTVPADEIWPVERVGRLSHHLGPLGRNGLTAFFGVRDVGQVHEGQTVLVSGAAGGVGHLAGQLARAAGARTVGITGSAEKGEFLQRRLGYAAALDRRSPTFADDLRAACPGGVSVYFDTVGGPLLGQVLPALTQHGRIVCCGVTAQYDSDQPPPGPPELAVTLIAKSLRMQGFLVADFRPRWSEAQRILHGLEQSGALTFIEDIRQGLDAAPAALIEMLDGGNIGQLAVRLTPDPAEWSAGTGS